jgi:hypothetical protein
MRSYGQQESVGLTAPYLLAQSVEQSIFVNESLCYPNCGVPAVTHLHGEVPAKYDGLPFKTIYKDESRELEYQNRQPVSRRSSEMSTSDKDMRDAGQGCGADLKMGPQAPLSPPLQVTTTSKLMTTTYLARLHTSTRQTSVSTANFNGVAGGSSMERSQKVDTGDVSPG